MAQSKQHRRSPMTTDKLYKVENTPVKETPRYDGDDEYDVKTILSNL